MTDERVIDGRFRVLANLGAGGMAAVYLVDNLATGQREALKVLHATMSDSPNIIARFRREGRAIGLLDHPNIVALHEFGRLDDGSLYLATEHAFGLSLDQRVATGRLPVRVALSLLWQVAAALDHAHARGVIHRDLKPANLIVDAADSLKVIDFGIAKIVAPEYADSLAATSSQEIFGTPSYMAPEQIGGGHDPRIDLYALGCVAYELVVGRPPFAGPLPVVLQHHLETVPTHPAEHVPGIPIALDAVILRCLEKAPDQRFQTGAELAAALERVPGFEGPRKFDAGWTTDVAHTIDAESHIDTVAGSQALLYAAAEALLTRTRDPMLASTLSGISTLEIALDAIETEMTELEREGDAITEELERAELTDRAIVLAARRAEQEEEIAAHFTTLRGVVERVAPRCAEDRLIRDLLARERALRFAVR